MKCIVVSCITLVFFERPSAITLRSDLAPLGFFLIAMTRSKSMKRFNCVDLNEEKTKQYMPDQLLTRRNKPIKCFFSRVLLVSRFFLGFFFRVLFFSGCGIQDIFVVHPFQ